MSHAELIQRLDSLPVAQQAEVYDFVEFLTARQAAGRAAVGPVASLSQTRLAAWLEHPRIVPGFAPMSRDEANDRP